MTDTLLAAFKRIMSMTDFQTSWIQIAFYGSYFCLALPAAIYIKRFTYKSGILLGLGMFILGALLFFPASQTMVYAHFLIALFILAGGLSVLETASNPYVIAMGPEDTGTRRLNMAQSFNPIGSITGVVLSKFFILSNLNGADEAQRASMSMDELSKIQSAELSAVMGPYVGVAIILIIIWITIGITKMPKAADAGEDMHLGGTLLRLVKNKRYMFGVLAQFLYVGAQITVWSYTIRYIMPELGLNEEQSSNYYIASLLFFSGMRFVFTALMKFIKPATLLIFAAIGAIICSLVVVYASGHTAAYALVGISAFMSLMFPTIYGISVKGLGSVTKIGASGMIMAILGGAIITSIQGQVSTNFGIHLSYLVPMVCFVFVAIFGIINRKNAS